MEAVFDDQLYAISKTPSVLIPPKIRTSRDQGLGMALAKEVDAAEVAYQLQTIGGVSSHTTINSGGEEIVHGIADFVIFDTVGGILVLGDPLALKGTITNWQVGDVMDLAVAQVTAVSETGDKVTVTHDNNQNAVYTVADQQPNTHVTFHSDGHGGTELLLS